MANERELTEQLISALERSGIDKSRIRIDYPLGKHFRADCAVLGYDGITPIACFEIKAKLNLNGVEEQYRALDHICQQKLGVGICHLVCLVEDGKKQISVLKNGSGEIRLDADSISLRKFLHDGQVAMAFADANRKSSHSGCFLKCVSWFVASLGLIIFGLLDIVLLFPLTWEHLVFAFGVILIPVLPYWIDVFIEHPHVLDQIIKLLDNALSKRR